jgi:GTP-binding protein
VQAFLDTLKQTWQFLPRHFITSAETKAGKEELVGYIESSNQLLLKSAE